MEGGAGRTGRTGRPPLAAVSAPLGAMLSLSILTAALAGCGTRPAPVSQHVTRAETAAVRRHTGPPVGSRTEADAFGRRLLSRLILPPGARLVHPKTLPPLLRRPESMPGATDLVDVHRTFMLRQSIHRDYRYLRAHVQQEMAASGWGSTDSVAGSAGEYVYFDVTSGMWGINSSDLTVEMLAVPGGSLLRSDAQVVWYPRRSAAEHLNPARFHAVTVSARSLNRASRTVTRTFVSAKVITRLVAILNELPADPGIEYSCPITTSSYLIRFAATARSWPQVVASAFGCATDSVTVFGRAEPPLSDPAARLEGAAARLLGRPGLTDQLRHAGERGEVNACRRRSCAASR